MHWWKTVHIFYQNFNTLIEEISKMEEYYYINIDELAKIFENFDKSCSHHMAECIA